MSESVLVNAKASHLTDKTGNIILPRTDASLVTYNNISVAEILSELITLGDIENLNKRLNALESSINNFKFDIGSTENYYLLKELNNSASENATALENIKNDIEGFNTILDTVNSFNDRITIIENLLSSLNSSVIEQVTELSNSLGQLRTEFSDLLDQFNNFPGGEIINIEKTTIVDEQGMLKMSLLSITDLYEDMCELVPNYSEVRPSDNIIDAYIKLFRLEEKRISDMPEHIQDIVTPILMGV